MKKTYFKLGALAICITVLYGGLNAGIITQPESDIDFYFGVLYVVAVMSAIGWILFEIVEDIIRKKK
jgi:hypothetical protein